MSLVSHHSQFQTTLLKNVAERSLEEMCTDGLSRLQLTIELKSWKRLDKLLHDWRDPQTGGQTS